MLLARSCINFYRCIHSIVVVGGEYLSYCFVVWWLNLGWYSLPYLNIPDSKAHISHQYRRTWIHQYYSFIPFNSECPMDLSPSFIIPPSSTVESVQKWQIWAPRANHSQIYPIWIFLTAKPIMFHINTLLSLCFMSLLYIYFTNNNFRTWIQTSECPTVLSPSFLVLHFFLPVLLLLPNPSL